MKILNSNKNLCTAEKFLWFIKNWPLFTYLHKGFITFFMLKCVCVNLEKIMKPVLIIFEQDFLVKHSIRQVYYSLYLEDLVLYDFFSCSFCNKFMPKANFEDGEDIKIKMTLQLLPTSKKRFQSCFDKWKVCGMTRGQFCRKLMLYLFFISVLVNIVSDLILFNTKTPPHTYIYLYKCFFSLVQREKKVNTLNEQVHK